MLKIAVSGTSHAVLFAITDRSNLTPKDASLMLRTGSDSLISIPGLSLEGQQGPAGALRYTVKGKPRHTRHTMLIEDLQ